ncbi:DUF7427 family protein [[Mycobacterium] zoologicum]|uniref:DUF7427 family protein n=1 Tax=[Mycobacterium] zoologicum TaxID=2872311 RepID=UPI001CDAE6D6|nr:hypothetical protein [Mycolicibacter sp. MYC101]MEB3062486.1 hypothetical protein [Mycolicibacter sp. MYC101]
MALRPADRAWLVLAATVTVWDLAAGETLSSAAGRYHQHRPWPTPLLVVYLAAHLLGWWPARGDPLHVITYWKRPRP